MSDHLKVTSSASFEIKTIAGTPSVVWSNGAQRPASDVEVILWESLLGAHKSRETLSATLAKLITQIEAAHLAALGKPLSRSASAVAPPSAQPAASAPAPKAEAAPAPAAQAAGAASLKERLLAKRTAANDTAAPAFGRRSEASPAGKLPG